MKIVRAFDLGRKIFLACSQHSSQPNGTMKPQKPKPASIDVVQDILDQLASAKRAPAKARKQGRLSQLNKHHRRRRSALAE
jgi:hypothetical protein